MNDSATQLRLDTVMRFAADGVFVVDQNRRYVLFNEACQRLTGFSADDMTTAEGCCGELVNCADDHGRSLRGILCPAATIFAGVLDTVRQRMQINRKDGATLWVETVYRPIPNARGEIEFVLGVMRDVSETKEKEDALLETIRGLRSGVQSASPDNLTLDQVLAKVETAAIRRALEATDGHRHLAAKRMGISRSRLYRRMEALGIDPGALA